MSETQPFTQKEDLQRLSLLQMTVLTVASASPQGCVICLATQAVAVL